jgi:hypothetical protein
MGIGVLLYTLKKVLDTTKGLIESSCTICWSTMQHPSAHRRVWKCWNIRETLCQDQPYSSLAVRIICKAMISSWLHVCPGKDNPALSPNQLSWYQSCGLGCEAPGQNHNKMNSGTSLSFSDCATRIKWKVLASQALSSHISVDLCYLWISTMVLNISEPKIHLETGKH